MPLNVPLTGRQPSSSPAPKLAQDRFPRKFKPTKILATFRWIRARRQTNVLYTRNVCSYFFTSRLLCSWLLEARFGTFNKAGFGTVVSGVVQGDTPGDTLGDIPGDPQGPGGSLGDTLRDPPGPARGHPRGHLGARSGELFGGLSWGQFWGSYEDDLETRNHRWGRPSAVPQNTGGGGLLGFSLKVLFLKS